jgi:hypothetical protein
MEKLQDYKEDFSLLIEAGFVAVKQLDETSAMRIFNAAQVLSPDSTAPQIESVISHLTNLKLKKQLGFLKRSLQKNQKII